jgi:flagellin
MTINHNISALRANTQLTRSGRALSASTERLSSGYKINHAYDDPAGMAISNKMRTQIRSLKQASENTTDAISVMQIADGALEEVTNMLQRMNELAIKAANGTMSSSDRMAVQDEINQLTDEIDRVSSTTSFNTLHILNGELGRRTICDNDGVTMLNVGDGVRVNNGNDGRYKLTITIPPTTTNDTGSKPGKDPKTEAVAPAVEDIAELKKSIWSDIETNRASNGFDYAIKEGTISGPESVQIEGTRYFDSEGIERIANPRITIDGKDNFHMEYKIDRKSKFPFTSGTAVTAQVLDAGYAKLQLGTNTGDDLTASIPRIDKETLNLEDLDVISGHSDKEHGYYNYGATVAIEKVTEALATLSEARSKLGAYQNRLESTFRNTATTEENLTSAFSSITDTDMAEEMTRYTQYQVLEQAGTSVLAQANQRPERVLSILQG